MEKKRADAKSMRAEYYWRRYFHEERDEKKCQWKTSEDRNRKIDEIKLSGRNVIGNWATKLKTLYKSLPARDVLNGGGRGINQYYRLK